MDVDFEAPNKGDAAGAPWTPKRGRAGRGQQRHPHENPGGTSKTRLA